MRHHVFYLIALSLVAACSSDDGRSDRNISIDDSDTDVTMPEDAANGDDVAANGSTNDVGTDSGSDARPDGTDDGGEDDAGGEPGGEWRDLADLPAAQQETAVLALNDLIWVLGGFNAAGQEVATVAVYDPSADSWETRADFPLPAHHMNGSVHDGKIWVTGFLAGGFSADGRTFVYDPAADAWTPGPDLPPGRVRGASATGVIDGEIYVAGGVSGGAVAQFDVLDPVAEEWTPLPDVPRGVDHAGFGVIDGVLVVAAGRDGSIQAFSDEVNIFDPDVGEWETGAPVPTARGGVASAVLDGKLYVFGGEGDMSNDERVFPQVEAYDFANDTWEELDDMPIPRHGLGAASLDGVIYLPGGGVSVFLDATADHDAFVP